MKSAIIAAAALASAAIAQPHNHHRRHQHEKRDLVVEWVTEELTITVMVDEATTETFYPSTTQEVVATSSGSPGQFFQAASVSTSSSVAAPSTTLVAKPSTEKTVAPVEPTTTSISTSTSSTPVAVPTTTSTTPVAVPTTATPTTTTQAPVVVPSSTYVAPASSTTAAASSGGSGTTYNSDMTYYQIGLGSCGYDDSGLDLSKPVVAISSTLWDSVSTASNYGIDQPAHPFCDQEITIKYNGKTTTGVVRDRCPGCPAEGIDVSEIIFDDLVGGTGAGRVEVEWSWNSGKW
ncbi:hypothetical protein BKA67DRAFT_242415 [Truncatella angustata]|uniref:Uncharacterized protein n=1 Tax=Truncatella angustata TaxID=152316 RepID=A0A9P8UMU1_9PEZI|nr:uncharacterized protein BKA67DRAFT_242415 [Truncatella angustata]KAH6655574.1 hypothetical protein BKA67DRAFT_242415 [Truncatella angustata]